MIPIPTPTPFPPGVVTPFMIQDIDPVAFTQDIAMSGVQWYNLINQNNIFTLIQLGLLIIMIIVGLVMIIRTLNSETDI